MGNEIAKKYDMDEEPSATGGLACLWKIYKATDKASGQPVSVFVFTKEDLKDVDKALREQVLVILRRELKVLEGMSSRKHPSVVRLIESFEETKKLLAFVTERVSCSLADALGEGPGSLSPQVASAARRGFERYEVARGFFGLCEGLQFVHTIRRRLHLNLAPESIFLAPSGQFKLGGFGFSVDLPSDGSSTTPCPYFQTGARSGFEGTWRLHPVMAFSSPEATAPAGSSDVSCASDMFSLGCLMYQLCRDDPRGGRLITADPTPQAHQTFCATLDYPGRVNTSALVPEVQTLVTSLIQTAPSMRPLLGNVTINPVFHGTEVTVLKTIDGIPGRNPAEAATFLTSIRPEVTGFPLRVQRDCIMQPLMDACAAEQSGRLWAFALPIVTDVCAKLDRREIVASVQAKFKPALKAQPLETLASLVSAMPLFLQKTEVAFFRSDVVPMVCRALQAQGNPQVPEAARRAVDVQEAALKAVSDEAFHGAIDGRTRELEILPRVCWLVVKGSAVRVKVNALLCLSKTFHFFQVRAVVDKVLPTLKFCAERDETVAIQLCVLGCYDAVAKRLDRLGPVATHILPACAPMLACKGLNSNQFEMAVGIVQGMLGTVIAYRRRQIANPSATAIIEKKPTHPGGVPDEVEIARQRNAVLGGWKPLSPSAAKKASGISSPLSSTFPKAPASSPPAALNVADIFSTTPASGEVASAATPSAAFSGKLSPTCSKPTPVATAAGLGNRGAGSPSGGAGPYGGVASTSPSAATMGMFQGLTVSQNQPVTAGAGNSSSALPGGMPDPFASAGLSDPFGAGGGNKPAQGLSWMDDAFGAGGGGLGGGNAGGVSSGGGGGMGKPLQASGVQSSGSTMAGFSGLGGTLSSAPPVTVAGGVGMPPPQQKQASGRLSSPVAAGAAPGGGDPFAAFFDAAISGGSGPASSGQQGSPVVAPRVPTTGGNGAGDFMGGAATAGNAGIGGGGFMGGFGAPPTGGSGAGLGNGGGGGGGTIEDQLAKTQNEIAQLTRELGGGGMAAAVGAAATGWGMGGSSALPGGLMGGAGGEQGWMGGGGGGGVSNQGPAQQAQGAGSQDPFAFLGANSQGGQQGNSKGGARSDFDFLR